MQKKLSTPWINRLFLRLHGVFGEKWARNFGNDEKVLIDAKESWSVALGDMSGEEIAMAIEYCDLNLEWPPTPAQFRRFGKKIISEEDALQAAIRRDLTNPIVRYAFEKIGSWDFSHDADKILRSKFNQAYEEVIRLNIDQSYYGDFKAVSRPEKKVALSLGYDTQENATDPPLLAILSGKNISAKDKISKVLKEVENSEQNLDFVGKSCPWWNPREYSENKKTFKKEIYIARRNFLLSLNDIAAFSRSRDDQIDRLRFIGEKEAAEMIEKNRREYEMRKPATEDPRQKFSSKYHD